MNILGMTFILLSAVFFSCQRAHQMHERILLLEELCDFVRQMRLEVSCYLKPIAEVNYTSVLLDKVGFFKDIKEIGIAEAFLKLENKLFLGERNRENLRRFFSSVDKGYIADEIKLMDEALSELTDLIKQEREAEPRQKKLTMTLSCSASLALIILLI